MIEPTSPDGEGALVGVDVAYGVNSGEFRFYLVAGVNPS